MKIALIEKCSMCGRRCQGWERIACTEDGVKHYYCDRCFAIKYNIGPVPVRVCCGCGKEQDTWGNIACHTDDNGNKQYYCRECFSKTFEGSYPYTPAFCSGFDREINLEKNPMKEKKE